MNMSDQELTRQEEDVVAPEFDLEEIRDGHSFGNWPEVIGLIFTVFVCWLTFAFRG